MPYLRNNIAYDHDVWYTCVKWWYLQAFYFFISWKFWSSGLVGGEKVQKMAQNDKQLYLSCSVSHEPYTIWSFFMVHMCKMIISVGFFLIVLKFWFCGLLVGYKGKKWPKMTNNSACRAPYLTNHTSNVPHFGTHV